MLASSSSPSQLQKNLTCHELNASTYKYPDDAFVIWTVGVAAKQAVMFLIYFYQERKLFFFSLKIESHEVLHSDLAAALLIPETRTVGRGIRYLLNEV